MLNALIRLIVNAAALLAVPYIIHGVHIASYTGAVVVAIVLGIVNAVIRPIFFLVTLPLVIVTLGLFTFVINALMFLLVANLHLGLSVDDFGSALLGALVLSIVSFVLSSLVKAAEAPAK